jgi:cytochrome c oxidase subunit II
MSSERSEVRSNRRLRWVAIPVAVSIVIVLAGCTQEQLRGYLPGDAGITNHTDRVVGLWSSAWMVLLIVGLIVWGMIIWTAVVYRRRKGQVGLPVQLRYNLPIEILYTVVPLIFIIGFFAFTARDQEIIEDPTPNPDVQIEVVAKQWSWDFNYLNDGPDDKGVYSTGVQARGIDTPPYIAEDELPVLYLPVGKTVQVKETSRDVVHSFWVVDFLYKKDVIPGKTNYLYFTPEKEGTYRGKCAELCGEYHSLMLFTVKVVSQEEYDNQLQKLADLGQVGSVDSAYNRNQNQPGNKAPAGNE